MIYCPPAKRLRTESPLVPDRLRRPTPQLLPPPQISTEIASQVHTAPATGAEDSPGRTNSRAIKLDCQFVNLVANTKTCCQEKEESDINFLRTLKNVLTTLPISTKHRHMHFLEEKEDSINHAKDVNELFKILKPYWNYSDYSLLEHIIRVFGTKELISEVDEYIAELECFEKNTTIQNAEVATKCNFEVPDGFKTVAITQGKDPKKCTLYALRRFQGELADCAALMRYTLIKKLIRASSVKIVLAFPLKAFVYLKKVINDRQFKEMHEIVSVDFIPPENSTHISVHVMPGLSCMILFSKFLPRKLLLGLFVCLSVSTISRKR